MNKSLGVALILSLVSCHQDSPPPDATGYACGRVITYRLLGVKATIHYSQQLDGYYISAPSSSVDTLANPKISVFCNLPDSYKAEGKVVKFDGSFAILYDTTGRAGLIKKTFDTNYATYVAIDKIY